MHRRCWRRVRCSQSLDCCHLLHREPAGGALLLGQFATTEPEFKAKIVQRGAVPPLIRCWAEDVQLKEMAAFALGRLAQNVTTRLALCRCGPARLARVVHCRLTPFWSLKQERLHSLSQALATDYITLYHRISPSCHWSCSPEGQLSTCHLVDGLEEHCSRCFWGGEAQCLKLLMRNLLLRAAPASAPETVPTQRPESHGDRRCRSPSSLCSVPSTCVRPRTPRETPADNRSPPSQ